MSFTQITKGRGPTKTNPETVTIRARYNAHRLEVVFSFGSGVADTVGMHKWYSAALHRGNGEQSRLLRILFDEGRSSFRIRREGDRFLISVRGDRLGYTDTLPITPIEYQYYKIEDNGLGIQVTLPEVTQPAEQAEPDEPVEQEEEEEEDAEGEL